MPIVLGVDPGRKTGWVLLEGKDADSLRVVREEIGVCFPNGRAIDGVLTRTCGAAWLLYGTEFRIDLVAIERQYGNELLVDTFGRWLGLAESRGLEVVGVWASSWQARFIGPHRTPSTVVDPETGEKRKLLASEKKAAKKSKDEAYRTLAIERFGLPADVPADVAAAAWVAAYAVDERLREKGAA